MFLKAMIGILLVLSFAGVTPTALLAAAPELSHVPAGCAGEATLRGKRERLVAQMKDVMASVKANKARCSSVESGSDLESDCRQEGKRIKRRYSEMIEKYKAFNESVLNQGNPEHIARGERYVDCDPHESYTNRCRLACLFNEIGWIEQKPNSKVPPTNAKRSARSRRNF